ncbi:hypothetical protein [Flavobacterium flavigenum]|uniref:hypothetical protein n=1 Tax=Flavobacterium flavigenum TaxID=3003258 RepID=UPI002482DC1F|nr:hypothetical protein [Flavobacterium flavigenum]
MKKLIFIFLILTQNSYSQFDGNWIVKDLKTSHILKGALEEFELPTGIIRKKIIIKDRKIDLTSITKNIDDLSISENHSPFFYIKEKVILKIIKDSPHNQFPGDELDNVFGDEGNIKSSKVGSSFTNILKLNPKNKELTCFKIYGKDNFNAQSLLITTENPNELVFFSYNDELIFFLKKKI